MSNCHIAHASNALSHFSILHRVGSLSSNLCLDDLQQDADHPFTLGVYSCHRPTVTKSQFFSLTKSGVLRTEVSCAAIKKNDETMVGNIQMSPCSDSDKFNERWEFTTDMQIRHIDTDLCLDVFGLSSQEHITVTPCDPMRDSQRWKIGQ